MTTRIRKIEDGRKADYIKVHQKENRLLCDPIPEKEEEKWELRKGDTSEEGF